MLQQQKLKRPIRLLDLMLTISNLSFVLSKACLLYHVKIFTTMVYGSSIAIMSALSIWQLVIVVCLFKL